MPITFCHPELIDGLPTCRRCGIDFPPGQYDISLIRRPCNPPAEADTTEPLRLWFDHGLGDAVQFTSVLRHFRHYWPGRRIELLVRPGQERLFGGLADSVACRAPASPDGFRYVQFYDCYRSLPGMPSTKVECCLKQEFGLEPLPELWDYKVEVLKDAWDKTTLYCHFDRFAVLHYQGHCCRESKDLSHRQAAEVATALIQSGYDVLVWDPQNESPLPETVGKRQTAKTCCRISTEQFGKPFDAAVLAAILGRCDLCVGIDSGPAHLATAVGTKTLVVWQRHQPVHYYAPTPLAFHLLRFDRDGMDICEPVDVGQEFFTNNYMARCWRDGELGEAVKDALEIWRRNEMGNDGTAAQK